MLQHGTESIQEGSLAQSRPAENSEQEGEGEGIGTKSSTGAIDSFLRCKMTGKNERGNRQPKSSHHHGDCRHDVIEGRIGTQTSETLAIIGEARSKAEDYLRESMRSVIRRKTGKSRLGRDGRGSQGQDREWPSNRV
jgi:hypothetical protein